MNAPERNTASAASAAETITLSGLAFALLASAAEERGAEAQWLAGWHNEALQRHASLAAAWAEWQTAPPAAELRLHALCVQLHLSLAETLALALCSAVELEPMAGRALAWLQSPAGGSRPTPGLVMTLCEALVPGSGAAALSSLACGPARESGLLQLDVETRPLPEAALRIPPPLVFAMAGARAAWPGLQLGLDDAPPLPPSTLEQAGRYAAALTSADHSGGQALAIRCGHPREAKAVAQAIASALDAEAAFISAEAPAGLGPWLWLTGRLPVVCAELAPGEHRALPLLPGYRGPLLVASGPEGSFARDGETVPGWRLGPPPPEERVTLWQQALGEPVLAQKIGTAFRHSAARIHGLARAARFQAVLAGRQQAVAEDLAQAGRSGVAADLGTLAELQVDAISDLALVLPPALRKELEALARRCLGRDTLVDRLGPAARARHKPGVRALLYGPSGTGKTLAVGWLATRLGLPLYRVDLASVTSKYIGETEKNLSQLFARAEHAEVVLMFDEADAMFGKRTDVKDSNDRFANAQTNYLLQRIESFESIAILTSNSRARFDSAFARRLDAIIEFPLPNPEERRALWLAHLGNGHALSDAELNRIAACCDLAGGHIRNVVLSAAAAAGVGRISLAGLLAAIGAEYRKLGKQTPPGLAAESR